MGTKRQAETLLQLEREISQRKGRSRPPGSDEFFISKVLSMSQAEIEVAFGKAYVLLGRSAGGAHPNQISLGRKLEHEIETSGEIIPTIDWETLTMKEASATIKNLLALKHGAGISNVTDIASRRVS